MNMLMQATLEIQAYIKRNEHLEEWPHKHLKVFLMVLTPSCLRVGRREQKLFPWNSSHLLSPFPSRPQLLYKALVVVVRQLCSVPALSSELSELALGLVPLQGSLQPPELLGTGQGRNTPGLGLFSSILFTGEGGHG